MKRLIAILLLVLFFLGTTGVPLHLHYCCNMLAGVSVVKQSVDDSNCCGEKEDCCSDQEVKIDVDKDYLTGSNKQLEKQEAFVLRTNDVSFFSYAPELYLAHRFEGNYTPPDQLISTSRQVLHCTFLI